MPLPLTVSCFSKIQIGFTFLVPAHPDVPGQRAVKRVCVCYQPLDLRTSEWMAREYFTDSWRYDVFLISHNWIRRLVPIFLGTWGNCPKFHQKFDGTSFAIYENGTVFFQKRDSSAIFWCEICNSLFTHYWGTMANSLYNGVASVTHFIIICQMALLSGSITQ